MNRIVDEFRRSRPGVPHASGDEPGHKRRQKIMSYVFPTRVGMNRDSRASAWHHACVPHASGDEPQPARGARWSKACSPREWG